MLPSGQKLILAVLATFTLEVLPFRLHAPFPLLLTFVQCILQVVFCGGCSIPPAILPPSPQLYQNGGFSVLSSIGDSEESRVGEDESHVVFGQMFPGEKESVRRCVAMLQQPILLLPKFWAKSSYIFTQSL
jgi:hypothetical protein